MNEEHVSDLDRPWHPSGTRAFQIGDRVRIRLSAECPCSRIAHGERCKDDGQIGRIRGFLGESDIPTEVLPTWRTWDPKFVHNVDVDYEISIFEALRRGSSGMIVAPSELELVEATP